jgi:hypothetical protein
MGLRPPSAGSSSGTYKGSWAATTAYSAGDVVTNPAGALVTRIATGTSGATYDPTETAAWKPLAASQITDVRTFGAKCDARRVVDAACTINQATITSATAAFTQADVGKRVYVLQTGTLKVVSTIASVQSATQATAANTSAATFTGGVMHIGTDDSAAIQAAINSGAPVVFIPDSCVQHTTVLLRNGLVLMGAGTNSDPGTSYSSGTGPQALRPNGYKSPTTLVAFGGSGSMIALDTLGGESDFAVCKLGIAMRKSGDANSSRTAGCRGIFVRPGCQRFRIVDVEGSDGSNGIVIESSVFGFVEAHWRDARNHNLVLLGSVSQVSTGPQSLFQVVDAYGAEARADRRTRRTSRCSRTGRWSHATSSSTTGCGTRPASASTITRASTSTRARTSPSRTSSCIRPAATGSTWAPRSRTSRSAAAPWSRSSSAGRVSRSTRSSSRPGRSA